jgi:diguanylate cyclase (GGDEF)-like protein/PAS domain S-box-containing protein
MMPMMPAPLKLIASTGPLVRSRLLGIFSQSDDDDTGDVLSPRVAGRIAGILLLASGVLSLAENLLIPIQPVVNSSLPILAPLLTIVSGFVAMVMPWHRWRRSVGLILPILACALNALGNIADPDPYRYSPFFILCFLWTGLAQPRGRTLVLVPFYAAAYVVPLLIQGASDDAVSSVFDVGVICILAAETVAWVAARLRTTQHALGRQRGEARFRFLVQNASDVVTVLGADSTVIYASPATEPMWAVTPDALVGTRIFGLVHPDDRPAARTHLVEALKQPGVNIATELRIQHGDGSWRDCKVIANNLLQQPSVAGIVVTYSDITERKLFVEQLQHLAFHDSLTGLPNRALFTDRLERALAVADREFRSVGVLFLDIDNFKVINDSLGHHQGDALLTEVAMRIRNCVRAVDTVARLGGDEFTVLLDHLPNEADATELADRIGVALSHSILLPDQEVFVTASIGVALSAPRHDTSDTLLRNADLAMYHAKNDGKDRVAVFDRTMEARAVERMELETEMRIALDRAEFAVYYQPIFSLANQGITEFEALVRWQHPQRGLVLPDTFIPLAEETGLIVPLGQWVLDQACSQTRRWQVQYPSTPALGISVNLSGRQFQNPHLIEDIQQTLSRTGLDPHSLKLEITESVAMQDPDATAITLRALKALGVRLAIDDFGTGYSSLSYLKRFSVDTLKIDRSFVDGLGNDIQDTAIVQSVITLARALNLTTTGEGIETPSQQEHLRALGCDAGQGFLFARPIPAREIEELLVGNAGQAHAA